MKTLIMIQRPEECSLCKQPIAFLYKEANEKETLCTQMCAECPVLAKKLHGNQVAASKDQVIHCGKCGTSSTAYLAEGVLGCSSCYEVFADLIFSILSQTKKIPVSAQKRWGDKKTYALHIGRAPGQMMTIPSSSQLSTLHEALNEALKKENYEQAAALRDQIKKLTEGAHD